MDELDDRGEVDMAITLVARCAGSQQHDHRTQALAPAIDDVGSDLVDQHHVGAESFQNQPIDRLHIVRDERANG